MLDQVSDPASVWPPRTPTPMPLELAAASGVLICLVCQLEAASPGPNILLGNVIECISNRSSKISIGNGGVDRMWWLS